MMPREVLNGACPGLFPVAWGHFPALSSGLGMNLKWDPWTSEMHRGSASPPFWVRSVLKLIDVSLGRKSHNSSAVKRSSPSHSAPMVKNRNPFEATLRVSACNTPGQKGRQVPLNSREIATTTHSRAIRPWQRSKALGTFTVVALGRKQSQSPSPDACGKDSLRTLWAKASRLTCCTCSSGWLPSLTVLQARKPSFNMARSWFHRKTKDKSNQLPLPIIAL